MDKCVDMVWYHGKTKLYDNKKYGPLAVARKPNNIYSYQGNVN
jgi:hypothetical protein